VNFIAIWLRANKSCEKGGLWVACESGDMNPRSHSERLPFLKVLFMMLRQAGKQQQQAVWVGSPWRFFFPIIFAPFGLFHIIWHFHCPNACPPARSIKKVSSDLKPTFVLLPRKPK